MLLIDVNQFFIANLMVQIGSDPKMELSEDLIRHMVLNSLRSYVKRYKNQEIVICCDNATYWRKEYFPYYKAKRKIDREASKFDWNLIFNTINKITQEIKDYFPYKVLNVEGAEADDIIATLILQDVGKTDYLILSSDKDFLQLQVHQGVKQYSPILKKFISTNDPYKYKKEHIIKGDKGDGIPNFLSRDDVFMVNTRQSSVTAKNLENWASMEPEKFCKSMEQLRNYKRNETLIDFNCIPGEIRERILEAYNTTPVQHGKLLEYMMQYNLKNLMENITDF